MRLAHATLLASLALLVACPPAEAPEDDAPKVAEGPDADMVSRLAALDTQGLGDPALSWDWIPPVRATKDSPHMLLVVPVEFTDVKFDRFKDEEFQGEYLASYYQEFLFDSDYQRQDTLSHFYADQSGGAYHLDGQVVEPVQLEKPLRDYGSPVRPEGGSWRNDSATEDLIEEALVAARAANPDLAWADFDRWDPQDFDDDGVFDEPDGYMDHLILVYAGGGQHACQAIFKLDTALNPNVGMEALGSLSPGERACADRLWPHRSIVKRREGQGPSVDGVEHLQGGIPVHEGLWAADYNMQCEYTDSSTFLHEFGHSIGLPDIYSRTSSNSTGPWDIMSSTSDPAQSFSAWSRMTLGWLRPEVLVPPAYGGQAEASFWLTALDNPMGNHEQLHRAAMVVLPPKQRAIQLTSLPETSGASAMYSGQGNDLSRTLSVEVDLTSPGDDPTLAFDTWFDIEAAWDFAYVEVSEDGRTWQRITPVEAGHMPAEHGHDGVGTVPGFTGVSGDLDGDGKNESNPACDPTQEVIEGEDKATAQANPCEDATWVRPSFSLSAWTGKTIQVRWRYYTDGAAVEPGMLIDNVALPGLTQDFEGELAAPWTRGEWTPSPGHHDVLVPHYYMIEYRDPYAPGTYDAHMAGDYGHAFYYSHLDGSMHAFTATPRPGVVLWYYDGAYAWSENDPAMNGQGHGYLLVVDSNPVELPIAPVEDLLQSTGPYDSHYVLEGDGVQERLAEGFYQSMCFVRETTHVPPGLDRALLAEHCADGYAGVQGVLLDGKSFRNKYEIRDLLPGPDKEAWAGAGEVFDYRSRKGELTYRLRDRSLRYVHTLDSPFHWEDFAGGTTFYRVEGDGLVEESTRSHPAQASFSDADPARWLNPNLKFGSVEVPQAGFSFEVMEPGEGAPMGAVAKIAIRWSE